MAPEQVEASPEIDARADIYALGVIMYRIATGQLPFDAPTLAEILIMQIQKIPDPPRSVNPDISPEFELVIQKALAKRPNDRYQNMAELGAAVQHAILARKRPATIAPTKAPAIDLPDRVTIKPIEAKAKAAERQAAFQVRVEVGDLARLRQTYANDISKGGMWIASDEKLPPQFTALDVVIVAPHGKGEVTLRGEVVRLVTISESSSYNTKPGMGVQFLNLDASARKQLERMIAGIPTPHPSTMRAQTKSSQAEAVIAMYDAIQSGGPYDVLSVSPQADESEIRDSARKLLRDTDPAHLAPVSPDQQDRLLAIQSRLKHAEEVLLNPISRAELDAGKGNYLGVARALAAGLKLHELAQLRRTFLATHASAETSAQPHMRQAVIAERSGRIDQAIAALNKALELDPLNIALHQRYWALKRQQSATKK
jgi:serine/threonine-protein kinase